jgi:hypothetical protein
MIHPDTSPMPEWQACVLAPIAFAIGIYVWLIFVNRSNTADLTQPFSLALPFFPVGRYPLRFFLLGAIAFILLGAESSLVSVYLYGRFAGKTISLFLGVGILIGVLSWIRLHRQSVRL